MLNRLIDCPVDKRALTSGLTLAFPRSDGPNPTASRVSQHLRPVLMTPLLASLGLLPAAMSHAIESDTQRPFLIVIIGGLISSTMLVTGRP